MCSFVFSFTLSHAKKNLRQIGCIMKTSRVVFFLFLLLPPNSYASFVLSRKCTTQKLFSPFALNCDSLHKTKTFFPSPPPTRKTKRSKGIEICKKATTNTSPYTQHKNGPFARKAITKHPLDDAPISSCPKAEIVFFWGGLVGWRKLLIVFGKNGRKKMGCCCRGFRKEEVNLERI